MNWCIITARTRSLRRLCFYTRQSVILFTAGVSASVHAGIHPPRVDPPLRADTPKSSHPPPTPCAVHTGRYGQQAGGTHPTGMDTCYIS